MRHETYGKGGAVEHAQSSDGSNPEDKPGLPPEIQIPGPEGRGE